METQIFSYPSAPYTETGVGFMGTSVRWSRDEERQKDMVQMTDKEREGGRETGERESWRDIERPSEMWRDRDSEI